MKTSSSHSSTLLTSRIPPNDHDQQKQDNKSRNTEWVASALRVCGKWSEQLSSKGKIYYYNCETYTSQWQKPVDWNLPDMTQSELHRFISDRQEEAQGIKRPYSALSQSDRSKSRSQDNTSPKRAKTMVVKNSTDRSKTENISYPRSDHYNSHRDSPRSSDHSGHFSAQRLLTSSKDSYESEAVMSSTVSSTYAVNCRESTNNRDSINTAILNKVHHNSINAEANRVDSHSPKPRAVVPPKLASCTISNRSPLVTTASSGQLTSSDPQSSTSQCSSPFPRNEGVHNESHQSQQHSNMYQRIYPTEMPVLSNGGSLLPDPHAKDIASSNNMDRHSIVSDKQSVSPHRTNSLKPDQVLRNLVPVLTYVIANNNNRTPHVNSASRSQPSVVNLISSILESHKKLTDVRSVSRTSSPASNRTSLNGSDRVKNERTPGCPTSSSDGASAISPCPRSSPSPVVTSSASDFRNHPQKRHSPVVEPRTTTNDPQNYGRSHSSETHNAAASSVSLIFSGNVYPESAKDSLELKPHTYVPLDTPEMLRFVDPHLSSQFQHAVADTLETEAQSLMCTYDRLHSVLFSELTGEMKKLRALLSISEAKIKIHQRRQEALQELMNTSEMRKPLPRLSSPEPSV